MNRLMIGAGNQRREGWLTLDAHGGDFTARIPPLPSAVKAVAWDEVEWIHGVTSLYPWEAEQVLSEIHSCMVPGGKLILEQPDFRNAVERVEWLFGDPSFRDPLIMNKWSWSPESLTALVGNAGFSRVEILPAEHHVPSRDFRLEARA